jgi:ATP-dependent helicase HrpA
LRTRSPPGNEPLPPAASSACRTTRTATAIEELRVSFFTQQLGTAYPISEKRIHKALDQAIL